MQESVKEPCQGKSRLGKRESGEGTLSKGGEPGRVCGGDCKLASGGLRRRKCGRKLQAAEEEPCRGKSRLGKQKCANVGPKHAWYSRSRGGKIYKTGDYVVSGGQYNQCRNKIIGTTHGADGRKPDATEYSWGSKRNGRRDRNNGSTNSRASARYGEGEYGMVSSDRGRENVWDSSDNTGVL